MKNLSIYATLNRLFLGLAICSIFLFALFYLSQRVIIANSYHQMNDDYISNMRNYVLQRLTGYQEETKFIAETIGANESLATIISGKNETKMLNTFQMLPHSGALTVSDMEGHYLLLPQTFSRKLDVSFDPRERPWFIRRATYGLRPEFTLPYRDIFNNQPWISISLPIFYKNTKQEGVVSLSINPQVLTDLLKVSVGPSRGKLSLVAHDGTFIAGTPPAVMPSQTDLNGEVGFYENVEAAYYYASLTHPNWYIVYEVPKSILNGMINDESSAVLYAAVFSLLMLQLCWIRMRANANRIEKHFTGQLVQNGDDTRHVSLPSALNHLSERRNKLRKESIQDGLTGLYNRRAFDKLLQESSQDKHLYLAIIDIDNFKAINDIWGHPIGDEVLKRMASMAMLAFHHQGMFLFRYGGEELAVVFRDVAPAVALHALETLRKAVEHYKWDNGPEQVTFSAGFCQCREEDVQLMLATADALLYQAKRSGKNRIICEAGLEPNLTW